MASDAKITIRLPTSMLERLEEIGRASGKSRSALIREAVEHWLQSCASSPEEQRYVRGYLRRPEGTAQAEAVASAATAHWDEWE